MREVVVLIGAPGSGKTTWRRDFLTRNPDYVVVSSDDGVEARAVADGVTYSEAFAGAISKADDEAREAFAAAIKDGKSVIIDRMNTTKRSRDRFLRRVGDTYRKVAVCFDTPREVVEARNAERRTYGRAVPDFVIASAFERFDPPGYDEFDIVFSVPAETSHYRAAE